MRLLTLLTALAISAPTAAGQVADPVGVDVALRIEAARAGQPFGRVADLAVSSDGRILVADAFERTVHVFGPDGSLLFQVGSQGEGPGEFEEPAVVSVLDTGEIWVLDTRLGRLTEFSSSGELTTSWRAGAPPLVSPPALTRDAAGRLHVIAVDLRGGSLQAPDAVWLEASLGEGTLEVANVTPLPFVQWPRVFEFASNDLALMLPVPFSPEPTIRVDDEGELWFADQADGSVHRWSPKEGVVETLPGTRQPVPITAADVDDAMATREDVGELRELGGPAALEELRELIPATKPAVPTFFFDDRGHVWVMRSPSWGQRTPVDVYSRAGVLVASTEVDVAPVPTPIVRDGRLVGVARDALGRESILIYDVGDISGR